MLIFRSNRSRRTVPGNKSSYISCKSCRHFVHFPIEASTFQRASNTIDDVNSPLQCQPPAIEIFASVAWFGAECASLQFTKMYLHLFPSTVRWGGPCTGLARNRWRSEQGQILNTGRAWWQFKFLLHPLESRTYALRRHNAYISIESLSSYRTRE